MDCAEVRPRLESYAAGPLLAEEKAAIETHIAKCEGCRLELELTRAVLGEPPSVPPAAPHLDPPPLTLEPLTPSVPEPGVVDLPRLTGEPPASKAIRSGPALPSQTPAPDAEVSFADVTPASKPGHWDFEPAEPLETSPPEGSLFFAEEALAKTERNQGDRRSARLHLLRLALWSGGAILGLGLLATSVWMALAFHRDGSPRRELAEMPAAHESVPLQAPATAPVPASSGSISQPQADGARAEPSPPNQTSPGTSATAATVPISSMVPPTPAPSPAPTSERPAAFAPPAAASSPAQSGTPSLQPSRRVTKIAPAPPPLRDEDDFTMEPDPVPAEEPEPVHVPITKRAGGGAHGIEPAPLSPTASKSEILVPAEGEAAKPEATPVSKPIDRLHLATVHAAKGGDLGALRKLKSTWKNFISSATGPDRSRAKRELADCLWAIQEVTGRSSDRREALTAYREYVLNAPAGGADPRTVGRMRTLEDVLTDSK